MGLRQEVASLFSNLISSGGAVAGHTYDTLPDDDATSVVPGVAADTINATYTQIASTVGANDIWIAGVYCSEIITAAGDAKMIIATGAAAAESQRITVPFSRQDVGTAASHSYGVAWSLPFPIRVPNGTRLSGNGKVGVTTNVTLDVVVLFATGLVA